MLNAAFSSAVFFVFLHVNSVLPIKEKVFRWSIMQEIFGRKIGRKYMQFGWKINEEKKEALEVLLYAKLIQTV
ncbi:uncharacterized protein T551_01139 [Pneumocystis jirovecii RU7]|uniref:Uncharacterized protein n=1 Tax=Pneumocystis jirovecii (strain RU7) TaxID=1408657 RepID=A0A0W4ZU32_PNEJ7|nr:uncharacterized protein T551_01139 [Pneumocystis jirovecii RU7]KTW31878.1 hypothetical protein T551_01139 [Pneumocystis jirovecii RU7]